MPLFMDFHKGLNVSIEEIKRFHIADETVQNKYGVKYHQFWVNEEEGTVFCLMEGPDKESCAAVHREAHGGVACSIVEVAVGFYKLFMGNSHLIEQGHVKYSNGTTDAGIRHLLVLNIEGGALAKDRQFQALKDPCQARELTLSLISKYDGREVNRLPDDSFLAVFDSPECAVRCGLRIQKELLDKKSTPGDREWNIVFKIGLSSGQPVTESGDFFSKATLLACRLCHVASHDGFLISAKVQEYCNVQELSRDAARKGHWRILTSREEDFLNSLYSFSEGRLSDESFTIDCLTRDIGMSRPQLYRKMILLTGKSPNDFIRDLRMEKAMSLIKKKAGNISEIALEVGYNNPSYFAKCFQDRYGCTPSWFAHRGDVMLRTV